MELSSALALFDETEIVVIGDIILDIYIKGSVDRISPEAPIPILQHKHTSHAIGGAGNVAANLKGLGANTTLIALTGDDSEAEYLETMLDLEEIQHHLIKEIDRSTTSKTRVIAGNQQMIRIDHETTHESEEFTYTELFRILQQLIESKSIKAIVLEDYNKGVLTSSFIENIIAIANAKNIITIVDPKHKNFFEFKKCTVFKPNFKECAAQIPFKIEPTIDSLTKADEYLRSKLGHNISMITLAEHGIFISDGKEKLLIPTAVRKISDVSGAGDTVTAIATFGLLQSLSLSEIGILANQAAGLVCGIPGVHAIRKEELLNSTNQ